MPSNIEAHATAAKAVVAAVESMAGVAMAPWGAGGTENCNRHNVGEVPPQRCCDARAVRRQPPLKSTPVVPIVMRLGLAAPLLGTSQACRQAAIWRGSTRSQKTSPSKCSGG